MASRRHAQSRKKSQPLREQTHKFCIARSSAFLERGEGRVGCCSVEISCDGYGRLFHVGLELIHNGCSGRSSGLVGDRSGELLEDGRNGLELFREV